MDYRRYREPDICLSTGVLEGAFKSVIWGPMQHGSMQWSVDRANAVIALRCSVHKPCQALVCELTPGRTEIRLPVRTPPIELRPV